MKRARLALAIVLSFASHAAVALLLLKAVSVTSQAKAAPGAKTMERLSVTLWNASSSAVVAPAPAPAPAPALVQAASKQPSPRVMAKAPAAVSEVGIDEAAPSSAPVTAKASGTSGANAAAGGEGGSANAAVGTLAPPSLDLSPLNQKLKAAARSCYPPMAARFRLHGRAKVGFCVGTEGEVSQVRLIHSSGSAVLDSAVDSCVFQRASPLPREMSGRCFELPVDFEAES